VCAACRAHTEVKLYRRVCTRALCLLPNWSGRPRGGNPRRRQGRHRSRKPGRAVMRVFVVTQISWLRCSDTLHDSRCRAARVCHEGGAGLSPCARNTIREAISRDTSTRAASMQDTLSEGTAHAAQLAPSAVTVSAVGGSATRSVVADSLRRTTNERAAGSSRSTHARSRGVEGMRTTSIGMRTTK
jgi:hypothetical protein